METMSIPVEQRIKDSLSSIVDKPGLSAVFPASWGEQVNQVLSGLEGFHISKEPEAGGEIRVVRDAKQFEMRVDHAAGVYDTGVKDSK